MQHFETPNILHDFSSFCYFCYRLLHFNSTPNSQWIAILLYSFSIFTDYLDGYIARKYNAVSGLGKSLDATVDKVFFFGVLICLMYLNIFFLLVALFLSSHTYRSRYRSYLDSLHFTPKSIFVGAINSGKIKTVFQFIFLFLGMIVSLCQSYQAILPLIMTSLFTH